MSIIGIDYDLQLLENILGQLDIKLSELRDALRGTGNKTLTDLDDRLATLDSRLYSATDGLSVYDQAKAIRNKTDKLTFDASSYLYVNAAVVANPPNLDKSLSSIFDVVASEFGKTYLYNATDGLSVYDRLKSIDTNIDVALSSRASEATISDLNGKFPAAATLGDALSNPSTTIIGSALLGWDGTYWRRLAADSSSRLKTVVESLPSLPTGSNTIGAVFADYNVVDTINEVVDTTEVVGSAVDCRRRGGKIIYMKNTQDTDVTVTIEGSDNATDWYVIRDGISLPAGSNKYGVLNDRHAYIRAKAVASATPSTGSVKITVAMMSW